MKTLTLEIDLSFVKDDKIPTTNELWQDFLIGGCNTAFKDGLNLRHQARLSSIMVKLDKANGKVELEDAEYDLIKDIQTRAKFRPSFCRVAVQIDKRITEAK